MAPVHDDQWPYFQLCEALLAYDGASAARDLLRPWLREHRDERRWFGALARQRPPTVPAMSREDSWRLYAMSRIADLLRLSCARRPGHEEVWRCTTPLAAYLELMDELGFQRVKQPDFHPFFHEVVVVEQDPDDDAPVRILAELWPAHALGPLLFARAGCRVAAGRRHMVKEIAEGSTLYWAWARNNRPVHDLSLGWGHASQWRTAFRRDYMLGDELHYNVDAAPLPLDEDDDLTDDDRLELLRHRCFVRCPEPHDDRFPYDLRHREPRP